ncbi:hypothetical protein B0H19DRAFT_1055299 [Mycena capillaripes]|nr:hypothetical protein B0H19DRAFT_1055299 [Mycena capillaripes]
MSSTNPTARPPKAPELTSMPSTPGPQPPGGYPRNSVVFATNQWDHSAETGKPGLLAATKAHLPQAVAAFLPPSTDLRSPLHRSSSAGHTPGIALYTPSSGSGNGVASDSDSSTPMPTPGEFPTPGGRTFGARASSNLNHSTSADAERDYFGAATVAGATALEEEELDDTAEPLPILVHPDPAPASDLAPAPPAASLLAAASPSSSTSNSNSSSSGSGLSNASTPSTASTTPSSLPSISSPKSLKYAPSTSPSRPSVTKAGSAAGFGATVRRFASVRSRARRAEEAQAQGPGDGQKEEGVEHARGVSLDASASPAVESKPGATSGSSPTPPSSTSSPPTATATAKPSRRASIMRTLRGEAALLAGRVRGIRGGRASASS